MTNPLGFLGFGFGHARISKKRKLVALLVAGAADLTQGVLFPLFIQGAFSPFDWAVDIATTVTLLAVVGFKARLAIAFATELIPGLDLFPTWTALVLSLPVDEPPPAGTPMAGEVIEAEVVPDEALPPPEEKK
jgi:hypothetical protein